MLVVQTTKGESMTMNQESVLKRKLTIIAKYGSWDKYKEAMRPAGSKGGKSDKGNASKKGFGTKKFYRTSNNILDKA